MRVLALMALALVLSGCAIQTPVIDDLDRRLDDALGEPVAGFVSQLGDPAVIEADGALTRYGWRHADLVRPCEVELWSDSDGIVRQVSWSGYDRSCRPIVEQLSQ